jgi:hypothetical protein
MGRSFYNCYREEKSAAILVCVRETIFVYSVIFGGVRKCTRIATMLVKLSRKSCGNYIDHKINIFFLQLLFEILFAPINIYSVLLEIFAETNISLQVKHPLYFSFCSIDIFLVKLSNFICHDSLISCS